MVINFGKNDGLFSENCNFDYGIKTFIFYTLNKKNQLNFTSLNQFQYFIGIPVYGVDKWDRTIEKSPMRTFT